MKDPLIDQLRLLLQYNRIPFDQEELSFQIQSHPSYPSLHAVTGVLDHFNIENIALDVPVEPATLNLLPKTFMAQLANENGLDLYTVTRSERGFRISDSKNKPLTDEIFLSVFTGIVVAVQKNGEETISVTKRRPWKALLPVLCIAAIGLLFVFQRPEWPMAMHFLFSIAGGYLSYSIIRKELGFRSALSDAVCSESDPRRNCDAVLESDGAQLTKDIKLSDASLIYFTFLGLAVGLMGMAAYPFALSFSLLALPITAYSLYYQWAIAKNWCPLCLGIVGVLWGQAAIAFFQLELLFEVVDLSALSGASMFVLLLGVIAIWQLVLPNVRMLTELKQVRIDYFKFKKNFNLFQTLLNTSPAIDTQINSRSEIQFGNREAPLQITIITNPFCSHCKAVHNITENILSNHSEEVNIIVRFNVDTNDPESDLTKIPVRLLEIYHIHGPERCMQALHDIYHRQEQETWYRKWGTSESPRKYVTVLKQENQWCLDNSINFTPEILINGHSFPKEYERSDLLFFITELAEMYSREPSLVREQVAP